MKRNTKTDRKKALRMIHRNDRKGIAEAVRNLFAGGEQLALPMLDLITDAKVTLDSVLGHTSYRALGHPCRAGHLRQPSMSLSRHFPDEP